MPETQEREVDRITRVLQHPDLTLMQSTKRGKVFLVDDGRRKHVASTFCIEGDECVDDLDPSKGCKNYSKGGEPFFDKELTNLIDNTKLCFRRQYEGTYGKVYEGREAFRQQLDVDRVDSNPVLLGQKYLRRPGLVEGEVTGYFDNFDQAVQDCNANRDCTHMAIHSPFNILNYGAGRVVKYAGGVRDYRLKRDGFAQNKRGKFPCKSAIQHKSVMLAESHCKADTTCTGYDVNGESYTCTFEDEPSVLEKIRN